MSLLLDSLRRHRGGPAFSERVDRTARADAVLATLGYRKKKAPSLAKPIAFLAAGVVVAVAVAWLLWPSEEPRSAVGGGLKTPALQVPETAVGRGLQTPARPGPETAPPPAAATVVAPVHPVPAPERPVPTDPKPSAPADLKPPAQTDVKKVVPGSSDPRLPRSPTSSVAGTPVLSSPELFKVSLYHHRAGDFVAAEAGYRALLARNELDAQVHNNLGLLFRDKGLREEAIREFQRALIIEPNYSTARNNLGVVLMSASRLDEAASEFRQVIAQDPRDVDARVNLALVEKASGRAERARESLLRALTMDPRSAPAHFNLASLYEQAGERTRAMEHYRSFLELAGAEHAARVPDARARIAVLERQD